MERHHTFGCLDVFMSDGSLPLNPKEVLVFVQGEVGFIPFATGRAITGGRSTNARVLSRFMNVEPFNTLPQAIDPAWTLTQVSEDRAVFCISTWFPVTMMPDANHELWSMCYPMMRDIVLWLLDLGCEQMTFLSAFNAQQNFDDDCLVEVDVNNRESTDGEVPLIMPAWFMPDLFARLGGQSFMLGVQQDEGQYLDEQALQVMLTAVGVRGWQINIDSLTTTLKNLLEVQPAIEDIERFFNGNGGDMEEWR